MRLGKVVKSGSHCDYLVQVSDRFEVNDPPAADRYGFGSFVRLDPNGESNLWGETASRPCAVGVVYNSQLINPQFLNSGPRLSSDADPLFTPDLIEETRTLLNVVIIGELIQTAEDMNYGIQGIPQAIVPVNAIVSLLNDEEIRYFHRNQSGQAQFRYHSLLLRYGGNFANHLTERIIQELVNLKIFVDREQRALETLCREMAWRNSLSSLR